MWYEFDLDSNPNEDVLNRAVHTLDFIYGKGYPLALATWVAAKAEERQADKILAFLSGQMELIKQVEVRRRLNREKIIWPNLYRRTLNKVKSQSWWKPMPPGWQDSYYAERNEGRTTPGLFTQLRSTLTSNTPQQPTMRAAALAQV